MGDADQSRVDITRGKAFFGFAEKEILAIRILVTHRVEVLTSGDKANEEVRQEIQDWMPTYRKILELTDKAVIH